MGTVLKFNVAARPSRSVDGSTSRRDETRGEVIIFPGVRMERHALDLSARIGRKRDYSPSVGADRDPHWPI